MQWYAIKAVFQSLASDLDGGRTMKRGEKRLLRRGEKEQLLLKWPNQPRVTGPL